MAAGHGMMSARTNQQHVKPSRLPGGRRDLRPPAAPVSGRERWMGLQSGIGNQAVSRILERRAAVGRFAETQPMMAKTCATISAIWQAQNIKNYVTYRSAISRASEIEKLVALNTVLLSKLKET